jgi:hypothetical protein
LNLELLFSSPSLNADFGKIIFSARHDIHDDYISSDRDIGPTVANAAIPLSLIHSNPESIGSSRDHLFNMIDAATITGNILFQDSSEFRHLWVNDLYLFSLYILHSSIHHSQAVSSSNYLMLH